MDCTTLNNNKRIVRAYYEFVKSRRRVRTKDKQIIKYCKTIADNRSVPTFA